MPVSREEAGQKLLQYLERRLGLPAPLLHRWIRTGQIRVNGARCKPFLRLAQGDYVRIPPFASALAAEASGEAPSSQEFCASGPAEIAGLPVVGMADDIWALNKPAGLPVQPGTGHEDCVSARLASSFPDSRFCPVPAHRLDKDTSGILLVAASFQALTRVHEAMRNHEAYKDYVAWVRGIWQPRPTELVRSYLRKERKGEMSRVCVYDAPVPYAKEAKCLARPIVKRNGKTLLQLRLITGRTHQLRAQLAHLGHPVVGDVKYGGIADGPMRLHASRLRLPGGVEFASLPDWPDAPDALPEPLVDDSR